MALSLTPIAKTVTFPFLKTARAVIFSRVVLFLSSEERDVEASGFLRRGAARRPFSLAHPHVQRLTGKMAKSTNHTAHNQSYKNHRNGACCPRPGAPRGVDPGEARCFHAIAKHSRRETFQPRAPDDRRCLRLLRRERPRIRREVSGIVMARLIASRRRAAWLASPAEPAASSRASAFRGRRVLLFRGRTHF
jgi:hypothetical protein